MTDPKHPTPATALSEPASIGPAMPPVSQAFSGIPEAQAVHIRRLVHDLSNALEIIIQTSYLVGMLDLDANGKQWVGMLDSGVKKAVALNSELRDYIRANS